MAARLCVSDGGDGFLEAVEVTFAAAQRQHVVVTAPHGDNVVAHYLLLPHEHAAVVESAEAIGLRLVPPEARHPIKLGTAALGEVLVDAIHHRCLEITVGLGGSATCDGGLGMLALLEDVLLHGRSVSEARRLTAAELAAECPIDLVALRNCLSERGIKLRAAVDVSSPLLGPQGAAQSFAPQKGATPDEVVWLEEHLRHYAEAVERAVGIGLANQAGAGAAGGLGFAFLALGAQIIAGADYFLARDEFARAIREADIVLTAEGRFDATSFAGKAPWRIAQAARHEGKKVAIFCAMADAQAISQAQEQGIAIRVFGAKVDLSTRKVRAQELLAEAVADFLAFSMR